MTEFTGTDMICYTGDYELDILSLTDEQLKELKKKIECIECFGRDEMSEHNSRFITIPITDLEFETEVTIDVEPSDNSWRD